MSPTPREPGMNTALKFILGLVAIAAIFGVVGLIVVWMLNTLFGLGLHYTLATVTAGALLAGMLGNKHARSK